ncbi:MAG TPA: LacI family DNA-binding transcriptional regulator [Gemmatimonadaceae bacterium]|jgi:LacI family transcriptional regulator|nr:LacI family DNA-binding transcriptional regulator [Gemmatimonadaceae bacterium]
MPATIRDVARAAGVSVATVSRVFNNSGPVHEETRARVREVAGALRYSPNSAARSLITAKSNTLGVLLPDLYGEFFSEVIRGIDQTAQHNGYHVLVSSSHETQAHIEGAIRAMRGRVDGLIVMSPDIDGPTLAANLPDSLPVVLLNCAVDGTTYDAISVDNFGGAYAMVRHLLTTGLTRVAIITGSSRNYDARERLRGYRAALRDVGAEQQEGWEIPGDFTETGGYRAARAIAALSPRPTAVFAANDAMAIGALSAFREIGLSVPGDIAVAGFDDIPMARYMSPPLTSVHVEISELGARAMGVLLAAVLEKNRHERQQLVLPTTLVVRQSCGGGGQPV